MLGYLNQPEATQQTFRDDWFVTGDRARIDADGFVHITAHADCPQADAFERGPARSIE
jgi:acyl-CoA synthetase (AMP-forming)/AMP-acid ligase II